MVLIGYAPNNYGPEVWTIEYRVQQEQVSTRGEYWQTRILRPRFTQLYPPEKKKHAPRMIVEARYPDNLKSARAVQRGASKHLFLRCRIRPRHSTVVR